LLYSSLLDHSNQNSKQSRETLAASKFGGIVEEGRVPSCDQVLLKSYGVREVSAITRELWLNHCPFRMTVQECCCRKHRQCHLKKPLVSWSER